LKFLNEIRVQQGKNGFEELKRHPVTSKERFSTRLEPALLMSSANSGFFFAKWE
jgi:hypothetical protein